MLPDAGGGRVPKDGCHTCVFHTLRIGTGEQQTSNQVLKAPQTNGPSFVLRVLGFEPAEALVEAEVGLMWCRNELWAQDLELKTLALGGIAQGLGVGGLELRRVGVGGVGMGWGGFWVACTWRGGGGGGGGCRTNMKTTTAVMMYFVLRTCCELVRFWLIGFCFCSDESCEERKRCTVSGRAGRVCQTHSYWNSHSRRKSLKTVRLSSCFNPLRLRT